MQYSMLNEKAQHGLILDRITYLEAEHYRNVIGLSEAVSDTETRALHESLAELERRIEAVRRLLPAPEAVVTGFCDEDYLPEGNRPVSLRNVSKVKEVTEL